MSNNIDRLLGSIDERTLAIQNKINSMDLKLDVVQTATTINTSSVSWLKKGVFSLFGIIGSLLIVLVLTWLRS